MTIHVARAAAVSVLCALAAVGHAETKGSDTEDSVSLANPAAVFCTDSGGAYEIRDGSDGQVGICTLPDGTEVDAWVYFREQNSDGG